MRTRKVHSGRGFYILAAALLLTVGIMARLSAGVMNPQKSDPKDPPSSTLSEAEPYETNSQSSEVTSEEPSSQPDESDESEETESASSEEGEKVTPEEEKTAPTDNNDITKNVAAEKVVTFALPVTDDIIKSFDNKRLQYSKTYGDMRLHTGIDIIGEEGTPVKASGDGTVKSVTTDPLWGTTVVIAHSGGIETYYCGLLAASVEEGQQVKMSKIVGTIGKIPSECLDESHIHFAMKKGDEWLSPLSVMGLE